ncbi:MAG: GTP-binding protein Der [Candidatus [Bacteroides] periocalifornicus]|uniref:GTPase Der n=1 Tax=Candidatus [Bacteroides] periocalifornicus TaxID=1702214 RepID=A0A0Q4B4J3_9BACT|nr:MAG: GTP-binding protein Der [Candidatus [Bacteroides] periocalifornicus]
MAGIVAIVGRPNVGKSTLFNRLVGHRAAIVDEQSGVTRDRIYGRTEWIGTEFSVIDTGGYVANSDEMFDREIRKQAEIALQEADVVVLVVDVLTGVTDLDSQVALMLRQAGKPTVLVVNKVDDNVRRADAYEFYSLGLGDPYPISAINGTGTGEFLDRVVSLLPQGEIEADDHLPRITIVGRPNVGKSSMVNALVGEERNIVTPIAGTTRDAIGSRYNKFGHDFIMVDTAGLRKRAKVNEDLEYYSVIRAIRAVELSDVCLLVIDATRGFEGQDQTIFDLIQRNRKGIVIVVNKWDLIEKNTHTTEEFTARIQQEIAPFTDVPIYFTSAITKQRLLKVLDAAIEVYEHRRQRIPTSKLNEALLPAIEAVPPPAVQGKYIRIKYVTQLPTPWPAFAFFCNLPQYVKAPYKRYLENKIREAFPFQGVPIQIFMRPK